MKSIAILTVLAALFAADIAAAAGVIAPHRRSPARPAITRLHKAIRTTYRPRQHPARTATLSTAADGSAQVYRTADADETIPSKPGWFRSEKNKEAGWGVHDGGTQAVVGMYQRPAEPGIPGPQTYHGPEGRGAAGLSLSFKLGQ